MAAATIPLLHLLPARLTPAQFSPFSLQTVVKLRCQLRPFSTSDSELTPNRRVGKTASQYGIKVTTVYTNPDARSQHALSSPHAINLGDASAYLDGDKIIGAAKKNGCTGIHPGYGFVCLSAIVPQAQRLIVHS